MTSAPPMVVSTAPDGSSPFWLNRLGGITALSYSDSMPGGPTAFNCTVDADPAIQHEAYSPGRRVIVYKGLGVQWEGRMLMPVPQADGWALTADGAGVFGNFYRADWTTWTAANIVSRAVGRGLRWIAGNLSGGYLSQPQDSGVATVTDALNQMTQTQSTTWRVHRVNAGWQVDFVNIPTVPTRLLVATVPQARTLAGYVNALYVKYQATADNNGVSGTVGYQVPTLPDSIARHDRMEEFWDVTSGGVMSGSAATALGQAALGKYDASSYANAITVSHGQYLTMGGVPVDLACEHAGEVAQLVLADGPYGGEIYPLPPITFPVGQVKYDAAADTLDVSAFQSWRQTFSQVITVLAPPAPA